MKPGRSGRQTTGMLLVLAVLIYTAVRSLPFIVYRYAHPHLTETELQLYFFAKLAWWDLIPLLLCIVGFILFWEDSE